MTSRASIFVSLMCVCVVVVSVNAKQKVKPASSYFTVQCRRSTQKELNQCVKRTLMELRPVLKKGIPGLGIVPLEPLVIPKMELNQGSGTFVLKTTLKDFVINGLGEYTVVNANFVFDGPNVSLDLVLTMPELNTTANYAMDGQVLILPIRGSGNCEMNFTEVTTTAKTRGFVVNRDGKEYVSLTDVKWDIALKSSRAWFYNLFNGDQRLGDATNKFLNDNNQDAFLAIKHLPEEAFAQVLKDILARIFDVYSIDELFLD